MLLAKTALLIALALGAGERPAPIQRLAKSADKVPASLVQRPALVSEYDGWLSGYSPGLMEIVIQNRQDGLAYRSLPAILPDVDGYAAVLHCQHVGETATIRRDDQTWKVLVTDCAGPPPGGWEWMESGPFAAEVDAALFQKIGHGWVDITIGE